MGIDGLYLEAEVPDDRQRLFVYSSKYPHGPSAIGRTAVEKLVAAGLHFHDSASVRRLADAHISDQLRRLIKSQQLESEVAKGSVDVRLVVVSAGYLDDPARLVVDAANSERGDGYIDVWDISRLGPVASALETRGLMRGEFQLRVPSGDVLVLASGNRRVALAAVSAREIVKWPGIEDRALFDLNVRHEQGRNRVRDELDRAIGRTAEHRDFLAYHNGVTVVCNSFEVAPPDKVVIHDASIVNGTQSVLAFHRLKDKVTAGLRVVVKLVEVQDKPQLAREVSRRSNTQIPVNPRMLMANSGVQLRIAEEFQRLFPDIDYVTRTDATLDRRRRHKIANDDVAQLLCAVYNEQPWLAVKRNALFETENHGPIFGGIGAGHVVLADRIGRAVDRGRGQFPALYQEAWRLTRLVAAYLAAEALDFVGKPLGFDLRDPMGCLSRNDLDARMEWAVKVASLVLTERAEEPDRRRVPDRFQEQEETRRPG